MTTLLPGLRSKTLSLDDEEMEQVD